MTACGDALADDRLVTLTGTGGVGKTRLAIQVAGQLGADFAAGVWYVDLAPIADPGLVPVVVTGALGLADQPGRSTTDTLIRFVADRRMLVLLDNCEHLLDAVAELTTALLSACSGLTLLATSREPIGVAGEVTWRVPSLSLEDEAVELFLDRARRVRSDFDTAADDMQAVREICRRLDGMPLAIELAAARVRALSLEEIVGSLNDRFRLLTGGRRIAVRRQQTLRASVDWSHALLTEPERVLFRRLAAFMGGFDLSAARAVVAGDTEVERSRSSISSPCSSTSHWWWPTTAVAECAIGCWKPCASTPWKSSASPVKPTPCGRVTATTTPRWRPCSTPRRRAVTSGASRSRNRDRQPACGFRVEPGKRRCRARLADRVVTAAAVADARPACVKD